MALFHIKMCFIVNTGERLENIGQKQTKKEEEEEDVTKNEK